MNILFKLIEPRESHNEMKNVLILEIHTENT